MTCSGFTTETSGFGWGAAAVVCELFGFAAAAFEETALAEDVGFCCAARLDTAFDEDEDADTDTASAAVSDGTDEFSEEAIDDTLSASELYCESVFLDSVHPEASKTEHNSVIASNMADSRVEKERFMILLYPFSLNFISYITLDNQ